MVDLPKVWDLIERFKNRCRLRGWWVSEFEDVVHAEGAYHNFIWARKVHLNTFKSITANHCCSIRDGLSYRTVNVSYIAWVLPEHPPESIISTVAGNPRLLRTVALYDLCDAYKGKSTCLKLNETESVVFQYFERFLEAEYDLSLISKLPPSPPESLLLQPL